MSHHQTRAMPAWRRLLRAVLSAWMLALMASMAPSAFAHEMSMAEMTVRELAPGEFIWSWGASGKNRPISEDLAPAWPQGCVGSAQTLQCGSAGLVGSLSVQGVGSGYSAAIITIYGRHGQRRVYTVTAAQPTVQLQGAAGDERHGAQIAKAYTVLGIEHILSGTDHLLFVIGLLFLVGFRKRLIGTITAFTLAHSLTLAASIMGWLTLRSPPVEATIALSIVLVVCEALRQRETLARRWPMLVAFVFGLVHGLGFSGALKDIGLPQDHLPMALFCFNFGVELGQLAVVAAAWGATAALSRYSSWKAARRPALYAIGTIAAYWSWLRLVSLGS